MWRSFADLEINPRVPYNPGTISCHADDRFARALTNRAGMLYERIIHHPQPISPSRIDTTIVGSHYVLQGDGIGSSVPEFDDVFVRSSIPVKDAETRPTAKYDPSRVPVNIGGMTDGIIELFENSM